MAWRLAPELADDSSPHFVPVVDCPADRIAYRSDIVAYGMGRSFNKAKQNAARIAAMPDLLAALREARSAVAYSYRGSDAGSEDEAKYVSTLAIIDAAIAKAEGGAL